MYIELYVPFAIRSLQGIDHEIFVPGWLHKVMTRPLCIQGSQVVNIETSNTNSI